MPARELRVRRSQLAAPGSNPHVLAKAAQSEADSVFLDLEDAVAPCKKPEARKHVVYALKELDWGKKAVCYRINGLDTAWWYDDVIEVVGQAGGKLHTLMVPKVDTPGHVQAVDFLLTQVEAGTFSVTLKQADLDRIARHAVEAAKPRADESGIELTLDTEDVPVCEADGDRLAQVLDNLISNALKFTPEGGRVDVRVLNRGDTALIEVEDTGPGISPEDQEHLFERFYRAAHAKEQEKPGVGLGLAISQVIVEAHDGRIWLDSAPGKGTTFHVELPLRQPAKPSIG
jgi:hypothetical protein